MTNMKQKKLEASCSRRQNLKQTRPRSQSSEPEKNGPSEDNKSHTPSQTECIVVPAVSLDMDANEGSDPEITEYYESETNDLEVIINGNTDPKDCEEIDSKICDLTDNSGKNENGNINTEELNSEENTEEGESGKTQQTLGDLCTGSDFNDKTGETKENSENVRETEKNHDIDSDVIDKQQTDKDIKTEMKGTKTDLRTIEEENEGRTDAGSESSTSRKSTKRDRNSQRRSISAMSTPRHASSRHSFSCVEGRQSLLGSNRVPRRSQSALERPKSKSRASLGDPFRFTKAELEWYLPRKSFFDCHDKALKEAGVESAETTSRKEQMKQRVAEKIKKEKDRRERRKELENPKPEEPKTETSLTQEDNQSINADTRSEKDADAKSEIDKFETDDDVVISKLEEAQRSVSKPTPSKKVSRNKKKTHDYDEDEVRVDYQPLLQYLKYVQEHPDEFHAHRKQSIQQDHVGSRASPWIVRLAEITERRNMTTAQCLVTKSVVLEAARDIRPRMTDPGQWTMSQKERALLGNLNPGKVNLFAAVKQDLPTHDSQNQDDGKSDFEKEKAKLEKWLKTVSTAGLIKAKELALRDLGEEDIYQSKWWSSLQTCSYLRQKGINST